jgi:hypothetical protein
MSPDSAGSDAPAPDPQAPAAEGIPWALPSPTTAAAQRNSPFDENGRLVGARSSRRLTPRSPTPGVTASGSLKLDWRAHSGAIPVAPRAADDTGTLTFTGSIRLGAVRRRRATVSGFDPVVRGRGLARLSRRPQPTTASELQRACVRWAVTLWVICVLFQRLTLPSQEIAAVLPFTIAWCVYGLVRGVLEIDAHRFAWWMGVAGISAVSVPLQYALVQRPVISLTSWGLLMTVWLVFVFRLRDRRRETYLLVLRGLVRTCIWLAVASLLFMASQLVLPYQDWVAKVVPSNLLFHTFNTSYPIAYGSSFYKSNAWIGLEPSVVSFQLGVALLAAIVLRATMPVLMLLGAGMLATTAGSGVAIALVGFLVILFSGMRWALARYGLLLPPVIAFMFTPWAQPIVSRATEGTGQNSSTGLRAVQTYVVLWPEWLRDPMSVVFGRGPGASQQLVDETHILGLLVPTPVKIFFDYGIVAGLAMAVFLLFMYLGGPSRAIAVSLCFSLWTLQPGTTTIVFVIAVPFLVTWWTPRTRRPIESDVVPSPNATIVPPGRGRPRAEVLA